MNSTIKTILKIFAFLLMLAGVIWTLQGLNLLPGTFMRGDPQWVINGMSTALVGAVLFWFANRKNSHA
jgi:hypothetical protein